MNAKVLRHKKYHKIFITNIMKRGFLFGDKPMLFDESCTMSELLESVTAGLIEQICDYELIDVELIFKPTKTQTDETRM